MKTILVIEDDEAIRSNILDLLDAEGFDAFGAADGVAGLQEARRLGPDVIVCDIMMPVLDGMAVLEQLRAEPKLSATPFIFLTARAERADVRTGMSHGADDYVTKPFTRRDLLDAIHTRLKRYEAVTQSQHRPEPRSPSSQEVSPVQKRLDEQMVIVRSDEMKMLYDEATRAAAAPISVLLLGETGVGKEVLAYEVHRRSPRADAPFIPLNCAALSPSLLEAELFGHEQGSFTGAQSSQPGLFETADGGTVFLDEIGELDPAIQVKLLRVLEDKMVMRVGSRQPREIDVRFVSATNRDLGREVKEGRFRQDLFFRLNGITLEIPPLRERRAEISPLSDHFVRLAGLDQGRSSLRLSAAARRILERYDFPGNVRELKNLVDRAVALCPDEVIEPEHLPVGLRRPTGAVETPPSKPIEQLRADMAALERQRIVEALEECGGNQTKAAAQLGISRRTLVSRLDEYDLPRPRKGRAHR